MRDYGCDDKTNISMVGNIWMLAPIVKKQDTLAE
jgi:hypothetical protein